MYMESFSLSKKSAVFVVPDYIRYSYEFFKDDPNDPAHASNFEDITICSKEEIQKESLFLDENHISSHEPQLGILYVACPWEKSTYYLPHQALTEFPKKKRDLYTSLAQKLGVKSIKFSQKTNTEDKKNIKVDGGINRKEKEIREEKDESLKEKEETQKNGSIEAKIAVTLENKMGLDWSRDQTFQRLANPNWEDAKKYAEEHNLTYDPDCVELLERRNPANASILITDEFNYHCYKEQARAIEAGINIDMAKTALGITTTTKFLQKMLRIDLNIGMDVKINWSKIEEIEKKCTMEFF